MTRRLITFLATTLVAVSTLSVVLPLVLRTTVASAQSFPVAQPTQDDPYPVVRWNQGSSSADTVEFFGTSRFRDMDGVAFASALLAGMGVDAAHVKFDNPSDIFNVDDVQLVAYLDDHWLQESSNWKNSFDAPAMARVAAKQGFAYLDIDACPVVGVDYDYFRASDNNYDICKSWTLNTSDVTDLSNVLIVQGHPNAGFYNSLLAYLIIGTVLVGGLIVGGTYWMRRSSLRALESSNLVLSIVGVFLASGAVLTTVLVYLIGVHTVDDVLVVHQWGWRQHIALVMGPAFITALPFLLSSIVIIRAEPRPIKAPTVSAVGGVPYWMTQPAQPSSQQPPFSPQQAQPQQAQPQQAQPQQWMPPPQQQERPSHPNPWDPPA